MCNSLGGLGVSAVRKLRMQIFHKLADIPASFGPAFVSSAILTACTAPTSLSSTSSSGRAKRLTDFAVAVTFEPHPVRILRPDHDSSC